MQLAEPDRSGFVHVNRTRLRVWEWGDLGDPAVLLVHGGHDHGRMFDELAPRVAALGYHAVAMDLRGHGDSGPLSTGTTWLAMNIDLGLLARHYGPRPAGFVAHSFGGGQALCAAGIFPEDVAWVLNLDGMGPPTMAFEDDDMARRAADGLTMFERVRAMPPREYPTRAEMAERRQQVNIRMSDKWAAHLVAHGTTRGEGGGWVWKSDRMFRVDVPTPFDRNMLLAQYRSVRCPVMVLSGHETDSWVHDDREERDARVAALADARHFEVDGAGHYIHLEQPDAVMARLKEFLAEVGG